MIDGSRRKAFEMAGLGDAVRGLSRPLFAISVAIVAILGLAWAAVAAPIYEQRYIVQATVTPLDKSEPEIVVSEVWTTLAYRDLTEFYIVLRVFGEALHFEYRGEDYFILKRRANDGSAGAYDPLRECLGLEHLKDYENGPRLIEPCVLERRPPMVVKVSATGEIECLPKPPEGGTYPAFALQVEITPTGARPSYDLVDRFPWISKLLKHERSSLPVKIPEEGRYTPSRYYEKDFVVSP